MSESRSRWPNKAHSVDAPIGILFHMVHPWRRATDARRSAAFETRPVL